VAYDLTPVIRAAIDRGGRDADGIFHWENFAESLKWEFLLKKPPTCEFCTKVLGSLGQVRRYDGFAIRGCHWQLVEAVASDTILRQYQ
jgi:hypothetical protein